MMSYLHNFGNTHLSEKLKLSKKIGIDARFCTDHSTGVGRHVEELIKNLAKLDKDTQYVCFMKPEIAKNFKIPGKNFKIEPTYSPHYSVSEQFSFLRQINYHNFDLMVFPQFNLPIFYRGKYVVTIHDLTLHLFPGKKKTDIFSRLAYKFIINRAVTKAKHIFAVSQNTKKDLIRILKVDQKKISVTYNGVSRIFKPIKAEDVKQKFRKKYKISTKYFLYTGVLRTHKNVLGLINTYAKFQEKHGDKQIDLVLTGPKDQIYWNEIKNLIKKLNLEQNIHHLGLVPHEEMNLLFGSSFAYIFPSFYEGFGIPPIEAMGCDIPVACSDTSSLPEACGDAALYFDPYDQNSMIEAFEQISFNKILRKDLVKKGQTQCQKFSWKKMTEQMLTVYKRII